MNRTKTVIITGSSRGIGKSCAIEFAKAGYNVVINYVSGKEAAENTLAEAQKHSSAIAVMADVSTVEGAALLVSSAKKAFGSIDILINNVGTTANAEFSKMSEQDFDRIMAINTKSAFLCSKAVFDDMCAQGFGRIIFMSSIAGLLGNPMQVNYAASKAALEGISKSVAKAGAAHGITSNIIAPGYVETELLHTLPEEVLKDALKKIPAGRFADPKEIADLALFLASEKAGYITGQCIVIDGGIV